MEWGPQLDFLYRIEKDTGKQPRALQDRPQLETRNREYLEIFNHLSRSRVVSQGDYQPISMQEIVAYMDLEGIEKRRGPDIRRVVQALDWTYLEEIAKKRAKERKK